jgi:hypothetical protein
VESLKLIKYDESDLPDNIIQIIETLKDLRDPQERH